MATRIRKTNLYLLVLESACTCEDQMQDILNFTSYRRSASSVFHCEPDDLIFAVMYCL